MSWRDRFCCWFSRQWLPASVALVLDGVPLWGLVLDASPPIAILDAKAPDPNVPRNGALVLTYDIERYRLCPGEIQRIVVDGQGVLHLIERYEVLADPPDDRRATKRTPSLDEPSYPNVAASSPPLLGRHNLTVSAPVPIGASPGNARYQGIIHYYCNWVQRMFGQPVDVKTPIIDFTILPSEVERATPPIKVPGAAPSAKPLVTDPPGFRKRSDLGLPSTLARLFRTAEE